MKKFINDFKAFIAKGNVMDMAIGVIIGGAFGKIVTSLVKDVIMPLVSLAMGGQTMAGLSLVLNGVDKYVTVEGVQTLNPAAVTWNYGNFIQTVIDFLIIAICVFIMLKIVMRIRLTGDNVVKLVKKRGKKAAKLAAEAEAKAAAEAEAQAEAAPAPEPTDNEKIIALLSQINESLSSGKTNEQADKSD